ncbi:MAG: hypothetical protein ABSC95_24895 [Acetobacteraceae bacterium]|jgi:hypothetical protein
MTYLTVAPGHGAFTTVNVGGVKVPAIRQEKLEDCGPSCIGLVLRMTKYAGADGILPSALRSASQASSGFYYRPAPSDVVRGTSTALNNLALIMSGSIAKDRDTGTYGNNIAATLREQYGFGKAKSQESTAIKEILRGATFANPYIVNVAWEGGGGHWIVACGHKGVFIGHGSYLFSDPYYGVGWITIPRETTGGGMKQPSYEPAAGARGHFSGWYISLR